MTPQTTQQIVAIPYYGALRQAKVGLARIYFIAHVQLPEGSLQELRMAVWNPNSDPNITAWFSQLGVQGILCNDYNFIPDETLNGRDIWIKPGLHGDVEAMLSQWLNSSVRQYRAHTSRTANGTEMGPSSIRLSPNYEGVTL